MLNPPLSSPTEKSENIEELLKEARFIFDPDADIKEPPTCISFCDQSGEKIVLTLGSISLVIGKAKSRKSTFVQTILAALITGECILGKIKAHLSNSKNKIIYFDTEQSEYDLHSGIKRLLKLAGISNIPPNKLEIYRLRKYSPAQRFDMIKKAIESSDDVSVVIIDGIKDVLTRGINDEEEAIAITSELLRLSEERMIHVMSILHQNKGNDHARGHIGSELVNKSETVIEVKKDESDGYVSSIKCSDSRHIEFDSFAMDFRDIPIIVEGYAISKDGKESRKSLSPIDYRDDVHINMLKEVFRKNQPLSYDDLWRSVQTTFKKYNHVFGVNATKTFVRHYKDQEFITQEKERGKYILNV